MRGKPLLELFSSALFIIGVTILFSIVNVIDQYMYNNIILGLGLAIGLSLMGINNIAGINLPLPVPAVQV